MFGKLLALLAVPVAFVAYAALAKPKKSTHTVTGKSGRKYVVERVSQFQQPDGLLQINDVWINASATERVLRYSQLGSEVSSRKYITSPFGASNTSTPGAARTLSIAAVDFGVPLPAELLAKIRAAGP